MPKRSRKTQPPKDPNKAAKRVLDRLTARHDPPVEPDSGKDAAAVSLGRRGGLRGGPARAAKMTPEERSQSAKQAAIARWNKDEA